MVKVTNSPTDNDYPPNGNAERRSHLRHATDLSVLISNGIRRMHGRVEDYSNGGVKIHWLDKFESPIEAFLVPQLVDLEISQHFIIPGKVTYVDDACVGIQFEIEDEELPDVIEEIITTAARKN